MVSNQDRTITVGTDVATIQDALDLVPLLLQHKWVIDIPDGDYSSEFPVVPPLVAQTERNGDQTAGGLSIRGNSTTPSNVTVGGLLGEGTVGKRALVVDGLEFVDVHPEADSATLQINEPGAAIVRDCNFTNATGNSDRAITAYGSTVITKGTVDLGTDNYRIGIVAKNGGSFHDAIGAMAGSVTDYAYWGGNHTNLNPDSTATLTAGTGKVRTDGSLVVEKDGSQVEPTPRTVHGFPAEPPQTVGGSRSYATWYQNTTGVPLFLSVSSAASGAGAVAGADLYISDTESGSVVQRSQVVAHDSTEVDALVSGVVPPDYYYKVESPPDSSIKRWMEQKVGSDL